MNPICVIDDVASISSTVASILKDEGYPAVTFPDAESFWQWLDTKEPSLVLLDIWLPGIDGMQLLKRLHARFPELPVIMMSGHAGIDAAVAAIKAGAYDFLEKPLHLEVLLDKVASALKHRPSRRATRTCPRIRGLRSPAPTFRYLPAWWRLLIPPCLSAPSEGMWS